MTASKNSKSDTFVVQHFRDQSVLTVQLTIGSTAYKQLLLKSINPDWKEDDQNSKSDLSTDSKLADAMEGNLLAKSISQIAINLESANAAAIDSSEERMSAVRDAESNTKSSSPVAGVELLDRRINAVGLVLRLTSSGAYFYSPSLDISHFHVNIKRFRCLMPSLRQWFWLSFSKADINVEVMPVIGCSLPAYRWLVDGDGMQVRPMHSDHLPPVHSRLIADGVEILAELCVGGVSQSDGFRIATSSELPPIIDVDARLADCRRHNRVFAWCALRRMPYNGCYWRIMRLASATDRQRYGDAGRRLDWMRVWNVRQSALANLPSAEQKKQSIELPPSTTSHVPDDDEDELVVNPVVKMMFPPSKWREATERLLNNNNEFQKQTDRPVSRPTEADIAAWEPSCSCVGWPSEEEHMGMICAYLEEGCQPPRSTMTVRPPPAAGVVDYVVQTPALKRVALLRRDVVRSHLTKTALANKIGSCRSSTSGFWSSTDFNNLIGEWIIFKGRNEGHMLVVCDYKVIDAAFKTIPTRQSVLFTCDLAIPKDFNAECDVLMVEQLGVAVFDTKTRICSEHRATVVDATIACDSSIRSPDALLWWIESVRTPMAHRLR